MYMFSVFNLRNYVLTISDDIYGVLSPFSLKLSKRLKNVAATCETMWLNEDVVEDLTSCPFCRHDGKTSQTVSRP